MLVGVVLVSTAEFSIANNASEMITTDLLRHYKWTSLVIPAVVALILFPLSGWLADAKYGNRKIYQLGLLLLTILTILHCLFSLLKNSIAQDSNTVTVLDLCFLATLSTIFSVGTSLYLVTAVQFGLDQMPDASAANITSFIAWLVFSFFLGYWISDLIYYSKYCVSEYTAATYNQIWSLFPAICMTIVLVSDFLLPSRWLIIEPESPQSLKTIYCVLKFAVKHKAPLNRSAFTYWEEDIPSRMDLGKSKYGGPFTTEEVEDVKTVLRMLLLSLSLVVVIGSVTIKLPVVTDYYNLSYCTRNITYLVTYNPRWCATVATILHELIIYPLAGRYIPSTLTRIGIISFIATVVSFQCLILQTIHHFYTDTDALKTIITITFFISTGFVYVALVTAVLEFACAQSPYKLKGLIIGYKILIIIIGMLIGRAIYASVPADPFFLPFLIKTTLCLFGFILHCVLAHWYKKRERDDIYSPHRVVEEIYDRYLSLRETEYS